MNIISRKSLCAGVGLAVVLSASMAFAQDGANAGSASAADAATPAAADAAAPQQKLSWSAVDADKSGAIDKAESVSVPALAAVFDAADGDADGALTAEEYKAYVAAAGARAGE